MVTQRRRGVLEGEILANQRRWIEENMEKRSGREADSYWMFDIKAQKDYWTWHLRKTAGEKKWIWVGKNRYQKIKGDFIDYYFFHYRIRDICLFFLFLTKEKEFESLSPWSFANFSFCFFFLSFLFLWKKNLACLANKERGFLPLATSCIG